MRMTLGAVCICIASLSNVAAIAAQPPIKMEHPGDTALSEENPGKFVFKSFPTLWRLYVFDGDRPGKSNCNEGCASAWPPLLVSAGEKGPRVGDWTIIRRDDSSQQWAYKDRPVYTRYHDFDPDASTEKEGFHLLVP
jgi:predicted lipoprotein with Yx(FWY)xxD motif